jgi:hypothetical protein
MVYISSVYFDKLMPSTSFKMFLDQIVAWAQRGMSWLCRKSVEHGRRFPEDRGSRRRLHNMGFIHYK